MKLIGFYCGDSFIIDNNEIIAHIKSASPDTQEAILEWVETSGLKNQSDDESTP